MNPLIILHGWSDKGESFRPLAAWLGGKGLDVHGIRLGDYLSMNDEISLFDLGNAFREALKKEGIPQTRHSFDLLVHSTGGFVAREYLRRVCLDPATGVRDATLSPIEHLCMLAPANFGSPLTNLGKSIIGRIFNGWSRDRFAESGRQVLEALDLASAYSFDLALDDLFDPTFRIFAPEHTFTTVMVGTVPYEDAFRSTMHENGSDGTVRVATANLEASYFSVDFLKADAGDPPAGVPAVSLVGHPRTVPEIAFAVLHRNHGTIIRPPGPPDDKHHAQDEGGVWEKTLLDALTRPPARYLQHVERCQAISDTTFSEGMSNPNPDLREWYHHYQHVAIRAHDQHGTPIEDYMIEFYQEPQDEQDNAHQHVYKKINAEILEKVTQNDSTKNYRSFFFDTTDLQIYLAENPDIIVEMSITAAHLSRRVKFRNPESGVTVFRHGATQFIRPNESILVDITLHRDPEVHSGDKAIDVFRLG